MPNNENDTILAVLQSSIGLAGLLLVFVGFLLSRSAELGAKFGKTYQLLATATFAAVITNLVLSFTCILALRGNAFFAAHALQGLEASLVITAAVAMVGFLASMK
jgi:hypothetical protein